MANLVTMHKRAVNCELCGKQFFPASLKFHMKACKVKMANLEIPCQFCDAPFKRSELERAYIRASAHRLR